MQEQKKPKLFYGWVVVFALMMIQGAAVGILNNTMSVFYTPVSEGLGVSRATYSLYGTFGTIAGMFMAPVWGEVFRTRRYKPFMITGSIVIGASMYAYSMVTSIYQFYIIAIFKSVMQGMLTGIPVARILQNWFIEKRGTATGVALAGSGLAGMIMTPIVAQTVESLGWRSGFRQLAIVYWIITIPVTILLVREKPEDMGLKPLGYNPDAAPVVRSATGLQSGMTRKQALRSKTFYLYVGGLMLTQIAAMGIQNNIINHMTDIGYDRVFAARIFSMMMGVLVIGKLVLGRIYDQFGMKVGVIYSGSLLLAGGLLMTQTKNMTFTYIFAVVFGMAHAMTTMQLPYMTVKMFGEKEYTRVYGILTPSMQFGAAFGTPVINAVQQRLGSYVPIFYVLSGFSVLLIMLFLAAFNTAPKEIAKFDREDGLIPDEADAVAVG